MALETLDVLDVSDQALLAFTYARLNDIPRAAEQWASLLQRNDLPAEVRIDTERNYSIALLEMGRQEDARAFTDDRLCKQPDAAAASNGRREPLRARCVAVDR